MRDNNSDATKGLYNELKKIIERGDMFESHLNTLSLDDLKIIRAAQLMIEKYPLIEKNEFVNKLDNVITKLNSAYASQNEHDKMSIIEENNLTTLFNENAYFKSNDMANILKAYETEGINPELINLVDTVNQIANKEITNSNRPISHSDGTDLVYEDNFTMRAELVELSTKKSEPSDKEKEAVRKIHKYVKQKHNIKSAEEAVGDLNAFNKIYVEKREKLLDEKIKLKNDAIAKTEKVQNSILDVTEEIDEVQELIKEVNKISTHERKPLESKIEKVEANRSDIQHKKSGSSFHDRLKARAAAKKDPNRGGGQTI